jgi:hypothetical protein
MIWRRKRWSKRKKLKFVKSLMSYRYMQFSELEPQVVLPLQAGTSYIWFLIVSLEFFIGIILQDNIKYGKIQLMLLKHFNKETAVDFLKHWCMHSHETYKAEYGYSPTKHWLLYCSEFFSFLSGNYQSGVKIHVTVVYNCVSVYKNFRFFLLGRSLIIPKFQNLLLL